jgi:hypothetical protein
MIAAGGDKAERARDHAQKTVWFNPLDQGFTAQNVATSREVNVSTPTIAAPCFF